jgi:hypothetical protein
MSDRQIDTPASGAGTHAVLYLDILGFKELVQSRDVEEVYQILDAVLSFTTRRTSLAMMSACYFSDTVVYYFDDPTFDATGLGMVSISAAIMIQELLARQIPCSCAIAYGELVARPDTSGKHTIMYGKALIEAYEIANQNKWLGPTMCPSLRRFEIKEEMDELCLRRHFERQGELLYINPFFMLTGAGRFTEASLAGLRSDPWLRKPEAETMLKASEFMVASYEKFVGRPERARAALRYENTFKFFQRLYGVDIVRFLAGLRRI